MQRSPVAPWLGTLSYTEYGAFSLNFSVRIHEVQWAHFPPHSSSACCSSLSGFCCSLCGGQSRKLRHSSLLNGQYRGKLTSSLAEMPSTQGFSAGIQPGIQMEECMLIIYQKNCSRYVLDIFQLYFNYIFNIAHSSTFL